MNNQDQRIKEAITLCYLILLKRIYDHSKLSPEEAQNLANKLLSQNLTYQQLSDYPSNREEVNIILNKAVETFFEKKFVNFLE